MVWYYAEGNQQRGPLSDAEFDEAVAQGRIRRETLVWQDGMDDWQSLGMVRPDTGSYQPPPTDAPSSILENSSVTAPLDTPVPALSPDAPAPVQAYSPSLSKPGEVSATQWTTCNQCGRSVASHEITRYGRVNICGTCRPGFVSQVQQAEGAFPAPAAGVAAPGIAVVTYAGFWIRAVARSLDHFLIVIIQVLVLTPFMGPVRDLAEDVRTIEDYVRVMPEMQKAILPFLPYMLLISVAYHALFVAFFSATPGKMMCRLRVIHADGSRVGAGQAVSRAVLPGLLLLVQNLTMSAIGGIILMVGYLMVAFDSQKRSLFDRIVGTRVIKKP